MKIESSEVKNENSSNVLGHQFKSGHFQCKTQIRQNNWVGTPCKGPSPHPHIEGEVCSWTKISIFGFHLKPYHVTTHLKAYVALICYSLLNIYTMKIVTFYMLGKKRFLQRKLSHSILSSDKTFPKIAKFIRKWFLFQYT